MLHKIEEREYHRNAIFSTIPKGIIITDTYNCPTFPLKDIITDKKHLSEIKKLRKDYTNTYGATKDNYLPYHYVVELLGNRYETYNTRPLNYKSLLYKKEEYLVIAVMGNSHNDIYGKGVYSAISSIISPLQLLPGWRIQNIEFANLGDNFQKDQILKKTL